MLRVPCDRSLVPRRPGKQAASRKRTRLFPSNSAKPCSTSTASLKPSSAFLWFSSTLLFTELVLRQQGVAKRALASADPYMASAGLQLGALLLPMLVAVKAFSNGSSREGIGIRPFNLHFVSTIFWVSSGSLLMVGLTSLLGPEETSRLAQGPTWEVFEGPEERFQAPTNIIEWLESMSGAVVVPAVVHEVLFRGFFLNALRQDLLAGSEGYYAAQNGLAIVVSAFAFSSCHLPPTFLSFLALFSLGSAAGVVAIRSEVSAFYTISSLAFWAVMPA